MKRITDVAQAANVSVATVSKVFNGYRDIAPETREKILKIAREMDYFPNHAASQLVNGKEDFLCVVLSLFGFNTARDEYLVGILSGIHSEAEKHGLRIVVSSEHAILKDDKNYVQFCRSQNFLGFILHGLGMGDPEIPHLVESEVPCVFIDILVKGNKTISVTSDNVNACLEVVDVLASFGHREIAFVAGSQDSWVTQERTKGYEAGMYRRGLTPHVIPAEYSYFESYEKVRAYLTRHAETTAFFCASDVIAQAAITACQDLGFRVPDDISIVGYDDLSFASYVRPKLSTVAQDFFKMGETSVNTLLEITQGASSEDVRYIPHELRMRQSVVRNARRVTL